MTTGSLGAVTYAEKVTHGTAPTWTTAQVIYAITNAFDAGFAKHLDTPGPELIEYTDPRWRDGATVRGVFANGTAIEGVLLENKGLWFIHYGAIDPGSWYVNLNNGVPAVYLLAEAPDPDEPILDALRVGGFVADQLASLRAAGYDVVRVAP